MAKTAPRRKAPAKKQPTRTAAPKQRTPPPAAPRTSKEPVLEAEVVEDRPAQKALPAGDPVAKGRALPFEIDPRRMEESLKKLQGEMVHWANKGRYTKVRFKFRGKQLLPDLPLAAVVAAE